MPLPPGVTTATVTFGAAVSYLGTEARIAATLSADRSVVHAATGMSIHSAADGITAEPGLPIVLQVPHVDQPGFIDSSGNAVTGWAYILQGTITFPAGQVVSFKRMFQALQGQTLIDLDVVPDGPTTPAVSAPTATVLSVAGLTGAVGLEALADALEPGLSGTFVPSDGEGQVPPKALARKGRHPGILSLVTGTDDEAWGVANCTVAVDGTNYIFGGRGWKQTVSGAVTNAAITMNPVSPAASGQALTIRPAQAVCARVWVEDASKVSNLQVQLYEDGPGVVKWTRSTVSAPAQPLQDGWNFLRWKMAEGLGAWAGTTVAQMKLYMTTTAATTVTWGHVYLETPEKARMIFVADRGYRSLVANGLPDLRAAGVPVTWALDILKLGDHAGEFPNGAVPYADAITEADVEEFAAAGDSVSFHGFTALPTATMTAAETRADTIQAIKWLQARGYPGRMWRAAWVQNQGPEHAAVEDYLIGQATWDVTTHSVALDTWPPRDIQNIARWDFYSGDKTAADIATQFDILRRTRGLMVVYSHGVDTGYFSDATRAQWDAFMANVTAGIAGGWLEPTTFEALFTESGGTFDSMGGATVARYTRPDGTPVSKHVL